MKVGIAQMPMDWTVEGNTKTICNIVTKNHDLDVLVFPELAITGFHRDIKNQAQQHLVENALNEISIQCQLSHTLVFIGYPLNENNKVYNAYAAINEQGTLAIVWRKVGLTPSECTFFESGDKRSVLEHPLGTFSSYLCREASDVNWVIEQLSSQSLSYTLWPSYIGEAESSINAESTNYDAGSKKIAQSLSAMVIQCNWPNSLNNPNDNGLGGSKVISSHGDIIAQLPFDKNCTGVFDTTTHELVIR
ncbi:carbon-nitrogen hydrolase family protein [Aliivibrio fischeri]|uniref:carbon-nitrogen hydrolase family protein n=1 Tax=Aliivibrio fischeri TaxID=668 RepID=UPI0012D9E212|nr:carbon-nitrogen hydrolase family protein [Aliivibrio fischeri]MUJ20610.1 carbon-nitrogen hydrolase family protein [Aliivibrio fischeri]